MTDQHPPRAHHLPRRTTLGLAAAALLVVAGGAGAVAGHAFGPRIEMAPLRPVPIRTLADTGGIVTIRGRVAEMFGNKYVIDDGSARALVDTGRGGDDAGLARTGDPVTVQGRFEYGFVHASFLVDGTGKVTALGPLGGPPPHDRHGPPPPPPGDGPPGDGPPGDAPPPPQPVTASAPAPGASVPSPAPPAR